MFNLLISLPKEGLSEEAGAPKEFLFPGLQR